MTDRLVVRTRADVADDSAGEKFEQFLAAPISPPAPAVPRSIEGVKIGIVVGFADGGATPLVTYPDQPMPGALRARATLDLHAAHIGKSAVLMFEDSDPSRPIVLGCLHEAHSNVLPGVTSQVDVDADGQRLVVSARDQIVLRCGKASITLTKEGKVIVQGAYVSNRSSGVLRIKGGSVHIN
jgi:hypothetical protein